MWENYSENLKLVTLRDRAWVRPSIQMQTTLFQRRGAVSNIASKCPGPETRAMQPARKRSDRTIPVSELESSFYSRYFVVAKRDGGLRSILDLRPINRALCKRPFRMISLEQILRKFAPGLVASVDLKDAYFHIQIALHHRRFLRFALEGIAFQYPVCSPVWAGFGPRTLLEVHGRSSSHPSERAECTFSII